jgi:urease accessory protein
MPVDGSGMLYGMGFMVATAMLHGFGITLGLSIRWFDEAPRRRVMQTCGAAIGLIGTGLVIGLV